MTILLVDGRASASVAALPEGDALWLGGADLVAQAGWSLEPQGLCQGDVCVPIPPGQMDAWVRDGRVNLAALWRHLGRPVLHDDRREAWVFGAGAQERSAALRDLEAPDFALPDLGGKVHRLSEFRGRRVFLVTWASW